MKYIVILIIATIPIVVFFKKKRNKKDVEAKNNKHTGIDVNFKNITHEGIKEVEFTIDDKIKGISIISGTLWNKETFFDYLLIYNYKDGCRELCFSNRVVTEKSVQAFVDELYQSLGCDWLFQNEFNSFDLEKIRVGTTMLRTWKYDNYTIMLCADLSERYMSLTVKSKC